MGSSLSTSSTQPQVLLARELFESYATYQLPGITSRRFSQAEMLRWLEPLKLQSLFTSTPLGKSAEGRTISLLKLGKGNVKVLLWSQMHGDESTATMALLDMLNFFARQPQHNVTQTILNGLSLLIIPMLNPDGAERFQRRTAQAIDMNRDAMALRTPEARILKETRDAYQPEFGFNLHDQDPRYTVGNSKRVSAVALLAPAYDEARGDNDVRRAAKQVASVFSSVLGEFVPGHVSKYDDTFEARAFGDNVQKWGTSTVLVESGGWPGDRDKMFIRKLNYVGLLSSLHAIAAGTYRQADLSAYDQLPFGTKYLYDVILRNAGWKGSEAVPAMRTDIGINLDEETNPETGRVELVGKVVDIGDLNVYGAFHDVDASEHSLSGEEMKIDQRLSMQRIDFFLKKR